MLDGCVGKGNLEMGQLERANGDVAHCLAACSIVWGIPPLLVTAFGFGSLLLIDGYWVLRIEIMDGWDVPKDET